MPATAPASDSFDPWPRSSAASAANAGSARLPATASPSAVVLTLDVSAFMEAPRALRLLRPRSRARLHFSARGGGGRDAKASGRGCFVAKDGGRGRSHILASPEAQERHMPQV